MPAFIDLLAKVAFDQTPAEAAPGTCLRCRQTPDLPSFTEAGRREFAISRLCEPCFDTLFAEPDLGEPSEDDFVF